MDPFLIIRQPIESWLRDEIYRLKTMIRFVHISRFWGRKFTKNTKSESWEPGEPDFEDARSWEFIYLEIWPFRIYRLKHIVWWWSFDDLLMILIWRFFKIIDLQDQWSFRVFRTLKSRSMILVQTKYKIISNQDHHKIKIKDQWYFPSPGLDFATSTTHGGIWCGVATRCHVDCTIVHHFAPLHRITHNFTLWATVHRFEPLCTALSHCAPLCTALHHCAPFSTIMHFCAPSHNFSGR